MLKSWKTSALVATFCLLTCATFCLEASNGRWAAYQNTKPAWGGNGGWWGNNNGYDWYGDNSAASDNNYSQYYSQPGEEPAGNNGSGYYFNAR